jgi:uncharacterized repeat protein (TIGR01451 family)
MFGVSPESASPGEKLTYWTVLTNQTDETLRDVTVSSSLGEETTIKYLQPV